MKKSLNEQKHLAQRRKGAEVEKKTKQLSVANLRASASLREILHFFTAPDARATQQVLFAPRPPLPHIGTGGGEQELERTFEAEESSRVWLGGL